MSEKVTEIKNTGIPIYPQEYDPTKEELQQEYRYYLAHKMVESLHASEAITHDEYVRLELKYRKMFHPHLVEILPNITG